MLSQAYEEDGDTVGIDEFTGVIELLMEDEFQQVNNPVVGRVYFLNKRTRKSRWKLPTVDEWLLDLHTATPPQLATGPSHQSNAAAYCTYSKMLIIMAADWSYTLLVL